MHSLDYQTLQSVLAETESHLRFSVEEIESMGFSKHEAEKRAVSAFGEVGDYGQAIEHANPPTNSAPPKLILGAAGVATAGLLLWALFVREYPYYHVNETIYAMNKPLMALFAVVGCAVLGSRVRARNLYTIALVGGILLVPILAGRFVGSGFAGGFVVRSLELRSAAVDEPSSNFKAVKAFSDGLDQLDRNLALVNRGVLPTAFTSKGAIVYLAPQNGTQFLGDDKPSPMGKYSTPEEATAAWKQFGESTRLQDLDGIATYKRFGEDAQSRLEESYITRLVSMSSYALLMGALWGTLLVAMQGIGTAIRTFGIAVARFIARASNTKMGLQ